MLIGSLALGDVNADPGVEVGDRAPDCAWRRLKTSCPSEHALVYATKDSSIESILFEGEHTSLPYHLAHPCVCGPLAAEPVLARHRVPQEYR